MTVCDQAYEALPVTTRHWSIPDPVGHDSDEASGPSSDHTFDRALELIRTRITALTPTETS